MVLWPDMFFPALWFALNKLSVEVVVVGESMGIPTPT